jgi:dephospho-CoA kinase
MSPLITPFKIGLTGGIGSGKSTVATLFEAHGIKVIDSDAISHQLTQPGGGAIEAIRAEFGDSYLSANGSLNRDRMRQLVFSDTTAKQRLEAILHPLIRLQMLAEGKASAELSPYLLLAIPLLFETENYLTLVQRTLVVDCPEVIQIDRTIQRSGLTEQQVRAIMSRQIDRSERLRLADDVIQNNTDREALRLQVAHFHRLYIELSARSG